MNFLLLLLLLTMLLALWNVQCWARAKGRDHFLKWLLIGNSYIGLHALYVFIIRYFFPAQLYLNVMAPFMLCYGPLMYIVIQVVKNGNITKKQLYLHGTLPMLFWATFVVVAWFTDGSAVHQSYKTALGVLSLVSFAAYTVYATLATFRLGTQKRTFMPSFLGLVMLMLFMLLVAVAYRLYKTQYQGMLMAPFLLNSMVYSIMLIACAMITLHLHKALNAQKQHRLSSTSANPAQEVQKVSYRKSSLSKTELRAFAAMIQGAMENDQLYLRPALSLADLSNFLRLPQHYITETLNTEMETNFVNYVNHFRIALACKLLTKSHSGTIDQIAIQCGFNSKVSFNRHFGRLMKMTPSAYRTGQSHNQANSNRLI